MKTINRQAVARRVPATIVVVLAIIFVVFSSSVMGMASWENVRDAMSKKIITVRNHIEASPEYNRDMKTFTDAMNAYVDTRVPKNDEVQQRAFFANLTSRIQAMIGQDLDKILFDANNLLENLGPDQPPAVTNFFDTLDAVAQYTVASDESLANLNDRVAWQEEQGGELPADYFAVSRGNGRMPISEFSWSRRPSDAAVRLADHNTDWTQVDKQFVMRRHLVDVLGWGSKKLFTRRSGVPLKEEQWVQNLENRLSHLYGDPDLALNGREESSTSQAQDTDRFLARDLARAHFLMIGSTPDVSSLAGLKHLHSLNDRLGELVAASQPVAHLDDDQRATLARQVNNEFIDAVRVAEKTYGFRQTDLLPDGIVDEDVFFRIIEAGYMPDDVGAGITHGSLSHRVQWQIIFDHFNQSDAWHRTPLDLYTAIGQFDSHRHQVNQATRFEFERSPSLWAQLFDQQSGAGAGTNPDLARPDQLLHILDNFVDEKGKRVFENIYQRLNVINRVRVDRGKQLRELFVNDPDQLPFPLSKTQRARLDALEARKNNAVTGDELYMLEYFHKAAKQNFERVTTRAGVPLQLLIKKGETFADRSDSEALDSQRRLWDDRLRGDDPRRGPLQRVEPSPETHQEAPWTRTSKLSKQARRAALERRRQTEFDRESTPENSAFSSSSRVFDTETPPEADEQNLAVVEPPITHFPATPHDDDDDIETDGEQKRKPAKREEKPDSRIGQEARPAL